MEMRAPCDSRPRQKAKSDQILFKRPITYREAFHFTGISEPGRRDIFPSTFAIIVVPQWCREQHELEVRCAAL